MNSLIELPLSLQWAVAGVGIGVLMVTYVLVGPRPVRLSMERRRSGVAAKQRLLAQLTSSATNALDRVIRRRRGNAAAAALEQAGISMPVQDFALLVVVGTVVAFAVGGALGGPVIGLLLGVLVPVGAKVNLPYGAGDDRPRSPTRWTTPCS
jgi:tight adherence protein B